MAKPKDIDAYLKTVPKTHKPTLVQLRRQIKRLYPTATEHIAYGMPLFKLDGHPLVSFRAATKHSSLFVWSKTVFPALKSKLAKYDTAMGTIRFAPDKPLPLSVIKLILSKRSAEIKKRWG